MGQEFNSDTNLTPGECDISCQFDNLTGYLGQQWDAVAGGLEKFGHDVAVAAEMTVDDIQHGINSITETASELGSELGEAAKAANPLEVPTKLAEKINMSIKP